MVKKIKNFLKKICIKRTTVLFLVFILMFFILIQHLFKLQIIEGDEYADNFNLSTTKTRTIKSTRGNIRDRNGQLLAHNQLSYSIILEDNGTYDSNREKNLTLNYVAYSLMKILEANGESLDTSFHIVVDENGEYAFDATDFTLNRFKADVYGQAKIDSLEEDQLNASAKKIMDYLCSAERFGLVNKDDPYTAEELKKHDLPESFTPEETLAIVRIRYALSANSFKKYVPATIATNVSEETVAMVMENKDKLQGVDIMEDSIRVYDDGVYFAPIIGYTGKASAEELEELKKDNADYSTDAVIGKTGIEQYMETTLQGKDGQEQVTVDNLGKVLQINEDSRIEPVSGDDVYLTIDKDLQELAYHVLEQKIAGILSDNIIMAKEFDQDSTNNDTSNIRTPIYDVYNALIGNSVIDTSHFKEEDASETEQTIYGLFTQKQAEVFESIRQELTAAAPEAYKDLPKEMQEYQSYIVNDFLMNKKGILSLDAIDASDPTYIAWTKDSSISLKEFLTYAASQNWIDISQFYAEGDYLDSTEVYNALSEYLTESLTNDSEFSKIIYKYMILSDTISGNQLCLVLFDQGILEADEETYNALASGQKKSYDFLKEKISSLEITPAQLALDPCSGSLVMTDVNSGEVLACVTYPGYDNNRLANQMDVDYYAKLSLDLSRPFFNKARQQKTAPGSTFKIVTAVAGMEEGLVDDNYGVTCTGEFTKVTPPIKCWLHTGHGYLGIQGAIKNSCNTFFNQVVYDLGTDSDGNFSDSLGLEKLRKYAELFQLDQKSGLEITEAEPQITDEAAVASAIGQGTNNYTTSQLARYATTIASRGNIYSLSLLDKVTDSKGNLIEDYTPELKATMDIPNNEWDIIHAGMREVVENNDAFQDFDYPVSGKTGTAQEVTTRPSHGLFIGFAPSDNPEIAMAVRIANGYSSTNAAAVAKDVISYKYNLVDKDAIVTGTASAGGSTQQTD